jgi:hypothetical protein
MLNHNIILLDSLCGVSFSIPVVIATILKADNTYDRAGNLPGKEAFSFTIRLNACGRFDSYPRLIVFGGVINTTGTA